MPFHAVTAFHASFIITYLNEKKKKGFLVFKLATFLEGWETVVWFFVCFIVIVVHNYLGGIGAYKNNKTFNMCLDINWFS